MISIEKAAEQEIDRLRLPIWANPLDHIKLDLLQGGEYGPWIHFYSPINVAILGQDPVDQFIIGSVDPKIQEWEPYTGPLPESEEYQTKKTEATESAKSFGI